MKRARLAIFVLAFGAVACSLLVDTEELTGARAAAADAADYDADAGADAALEASASDADTVFDAVTALDATSDAVADASGVRFCEDPLYSAIFCADFDGTDPFERFSLRDEKQGGTLTVTSSADGGAGGLSRPNALRAVVPPVDGGESVALLSHLLLSADQDVSLSLSARFGPVLDDMLAVALYIGSNRMAVLAKPTVFNLVQLAPDGGVLNTVDVVHSPSPDWVHLRFDIRFKGPEPSLTFYVDGVKKLDRRPIVAGPLGLGELGFSIGALITGSNPATIDYDNVLFDVKPLP